MHSMNQSTWVALLLTLYRAASIQLHNFYTFVVSVQRWTIFAFFHSILNIGQSWPILFKIKLNTPTLKHWCSAGKLMCVSKWFEYNHWSMYKTLTFLFCIDDHIFPYCYILCMVKVERGWWITESCDRIFWNKIWTTSLCLTSFENSMLQNGRNISLWIKLNLHVK